MLPAAHRLRCSEEFTRVVRGGVRIGGRNTVLHLRGEQHDGCSRVGFVVSRAVGPAVVRNRVKRRLRAIFWERIDELHPGMMVVVRALPSSARASFADLERDVDVALSRYERKQQRRGEKQVHP